MGRKKKEKYNKKNHEEEIDLIPIDLEPEDAVSADENPEPEETETKYEEPETQDAKPEYDELQDTEPEYGESETQDTESEYEEPEDTELKSTGSEEQEEESESSALFGAYVAEENKWERKNRIKDEKIRAKQEKKRAKYADVDDDTFERMKAGGAHKFFGMLSLMLLIVGIAATALSVYRLVIAPSYEQVGEKEKNLHVEGFATETDTSKYEQQVSALQGIATPSDLTDTWVEQPFEQATPSDVSTQDMDGAEALPSDDAEAKPVVD